MLELCDRVSVMKNGQLIGTERVEDVTEERVEGRKNLETISAMIKRLTEISNTYGG